MYPNGRNLVQVDSSDAQTLVWQEHRHVCSTNRVTVGAISDPSSSFLIQLWAVDTGKKTASGTHSMVRFVPSTSDTIKKTYR